MIESVLWFFFFITPGIILEEPSKNSRGNFQHSLITWILYIYIIFLYLIFFSYYLSLNVTSYLCIWSNSTPLYLLSIQVYWLLVSSCIYHISYMFSITWFLFFVLNGREKITISLIVIVSLPWTHTWPNSSQNPSAKEVA